MKKIITGLFIAFALFSYGLYAQEITVSTRPGSRANTHKHPSNIVEKRSVWKSFKGYLPRRALPLGRDSDGKSLYACRGKYLGSLQPGKTWRGYSKCNIAYGGKEILLDQFEVLTKPFKRKVLWKDENHRKNWQVGRDTDGKSLYLCLAIFKHSQQIGKTWSGYNKCNISYGGREYILNNYSSVNIKKNRVRRRAHPQEGYECIENFGSQICGYHCMKSGTRAACASSPRQNCVSDNFGNIQCGFNCVKSPFKTACASKPNENCVINVFNEIRCGKHCRIDNFNKINCG